LEETCSDVPPCGIFIDRDGKWYSQGIEMVRKDIVDLFFEHIKLCPDGTYLIELDGQRCRLDVADTAFVVMRVDQEEDSFSIVLNDGTREGLVPRLRVAKDGVLYCRVKNGRFPARFSRPAYYQIASYVEEEGGSFFLPCGGIRHPIEQCR
jgi:hypothetical protein